MQGRVTVFLSGKLISTGGNGTMNSIEQLEHTMNLLVSARFVKARKLEPRVRNIVATLDVRNRLDLHEISRKLSRSIYEPDQFPGLIYQPDQGLTLLIFASGKVVIVGAKSELELYGAASLLGERLKPFNIA